MEINLNKEIKDFKEELILGLDLKTCIFFGVGIGLCVIDWIVFSHMLHVNTAIMTIIYVFSVLPFAFLGAFKYNGRSAWEMVKIWVKYYFMQDHQLKVRPENYYSDNILNKKRGKK